MKRTGPPILVQESIMASAGAIWNALTRLDEMRLWYFDNIDAFIPEVGSKSRFPVVSEERIFTHLWEVTEVSPGEHISCNWRYAEYPGESVVTFSIKPQNGQVLVSITTEVLQDFPDDIPEFKRESCRNGWEYFMGRLKNYLS